MTIDIWLEPISDDCPCGPNLEDDLDFLSLEEASREKRSEEFRRDGGDAILIQGSNVNWGAVQSLAEALLGRSKDLRVAVYLTRALLHTTGFVAIADGLVLINRLLERYWDNVHPELEADEDNDPTMRINALLPLSSLEAGIADLRSSFVLRSRSLGQLTVREIEIAQGRLSPGADGAKLTEAQLAGLIAAAVKENPNLPGLASEALAGAKNIGRIIGERVGESYAPNLKMLETTLSSVVQAIGLSAPLAETAPASNDALEAVATTAAGRPSTVVAGDIRSRQDVIQTLGRLCDYLSRSEPTNPVQLVLRRAQRMMNMSFLELMQDVAPDGLIQAETVVGEKLNKDEEE